MAWINVGFHPKRNNVKKIRNIFQYPNDRTGYFGIRFHRYFIGFCIYVLESEKDNQS